MFDFFLLRHSPLCSSNYWDFREHAYTRRLSFSAWAGVINGSHDYFQLIYMGWKFQLGVFKPWWNFSSVCGGEISAYNCNFVAIVFTIFTYARWNLIQVLTRWNFTPCWKSPYNLPLIGIILQLLHFMPFETWLQKRRYLYLIDGDACLCFCQQSSLRFSKSVGVVHRRIFLPLNLKNKVCKKALAGREVHF